MIKGTIDVSQMLAAVVFFMEKKLVWYFNQKLDVFISPILI